jgi:hypothetical protein
MTLPGSCKCKRHSILVTTLTPIISWLWIEGTTKLLRLGILWYSPNTGGALLSKSQSFEQIGTKSWETVSLSQNDPPPPSHVKEDLREDKRHRQSKRLQLNPPSSYAKMDYNIIPERAKVGHLLTTSCVIHCSLCESSTHSQSEKVFISQHL